MRKDPTRTFVDELWDTSIVPTLCDYVRIPNKSPAFDPDWERNGYMRTAVELLRDWCTVPNIVGLAAEIVSLPHRTPVLFCEIPATDANQTGTVLLYGHYDKQPEFDGWQPGLSPWEPVLRDGKLYGRGGARRWICFVRLSHRHCCATGARYPPQPLRAPHRRLRGKRQFRSAPLRGSVA